MYPDSYCNQVQNGGTFIRAHWQEYWGGDCVTEKLRKEGYVNLSSIKSTCEFLPCCLNGPMKEYSIGYNWFECGYGRRLAN